MPTLVYPTVSATAVTGRSVCAKEPARVQDAQAGLVGGERDPRRPPDEAAHVVAAVSGKGGQPVEPGASPRHTQAAVDRPPEFVRAFGRRGPICHGPWATPRMPFLLRAGGECE